MSLRRSFRTSSGQLQYRQRHSQAVEPGLFPTAPARINEQRWSSPALIWDMHTQASEECPQPQPARRVCRLTEGQAPPATGEAGVCRLTLREVRESQCVHTEVAKGTQSHIPHTVGPQGTPRGPGWETQEGALARTERGRVEEGGLEREGTEKASALFRWARPSHVSAECPRLQDPPFPSLASFFRKMSQASTAFPTHNLGRGLSVRRPTSGLFSGQVALGESLPFSGLSSLPG